MSNDLSTSAAVPAGNTKGQVSLSKWANEKLPSYQQLLTTHDVTRLTRRSPWILAALALIGRFPKKTRFQGRALGWCRAEVLAWMARDLSIEPDTCAGAARQVCGGSAKRRASQTKSRAPIGPPAAHARQTQLCSIRRRGHTDNRS